MGVVHLKRMLGIVRLGTGLCLTALAWHRLMAVKGLTNVVVVVIVIQHLFGSYYGYCYGPFVVCPLVWFVVRDV